MAHGPSTTSPAAENLLPLFIYGGAAILLVGLMLVGAWWLGSRRGRGPDKEMPYESGIIPTGSAHYTYPIPFYLVAVFFIVFDVEAVFVFTWGVAWDELGEAGLVHITFFIVVLLLGLAWLWKKGGLDWGPARDLQADREERP